MSNWRDLAACRSMDGELWFPVGDSGPALRQIAEAKTVCESCPAQAACLSWALENGHEAGIWGGLTEAERRRLKGQRRKQARAAA